MAQNLSVPLAFVALLHLANEKVSEATSSGISVCTCEDTYELCHQQNLELVKVDDMSDIIIRQGQ